MGTTETHVDVPCFIQVEPVYHHWVGRESRDDVASIGGARAVRITKSRAADPKRGTVSVKVTLRIPKAAFTSLHPEAVVVIPDSMVQPHPVEAIAADPNDEE